MKRILIIEDEIPIAELERDYFELHGFTAELAHDGEEGTAKALAGGYDLIILDLNLPGADGLEVCRSIRAQLDVPILIVSARDEEIDKIRGFGLGADDFVTKPFSPNELIARAKAHLSRYERFANRTAEPEQIRIRELTIDKTARRVYVHGNEVVLTTREFDVLAFMAAHPNRVFSKTELFERLWGFDSAGDIATVAVHIRRVREKIEAVPSNPQFIETVWGAGYRFTV
ncbi:two component transcriptional regulator, winged helix family [Paenibacillus curdlanolyticus YK9]|uniref:Two component transcriptional regulator, winged helix family n=1 Tax=Paenibacillus curdlanolyticus YK9 TaxID=717606 RepID=E0IAF2_9BACL|nr:response regulator transcription factor [Paenibacillus curdlanolyticus]EFM10729.1 two component transcriptional regulator, winged helix family [Paenibacillus curdlanolyticus YK9]